MMRHERRALAGLALVALLVQLSACSLIGPRVPSLETPAERFYATEAAYLGALASFNAALDEPLLVRHLDAETLVLLEAATAQTTETLLETRPLVTSEAAGADDQILAAVALAASTTRRVRAVLLEMGVQ